MTDFAANVRSIAKQMSLEVHLVGGCVRDQFLGRPTNDLDVLVPGGTHAFAEALSEDVGGSLFELGSGRGMFRVVGPPGSRDQHVDVSPLAGSLQEDLRRRDFTINAIARTCGDRERLVDPLDGVRDLRRNVIRATSPKAFIEDPVRALRAVRLAAQLGFEIEPGTRSMIQQSASLLSRAAGERVRDEMFLLLQEPDFARQILLLDELELLVVLFPEVAALKGIEQGGYHDRDAFEHTIEVIGALEGLAQSPERLAPDQATELAHHWSVPLSGDRRRRDLLMLAALLHDIGKVDTQEVDEEGVAHFYGHTEHGADMACRIARRLVLSRREEAFLSTVVSSHLRPTLLAGNPNAGAHALRRLRRDVGTALPDVVALAWSDGQAKGGPKSSRGRIERLRVLAQGLIAEWVADREAREAPLLSATEIMAALDLRPGPRVGQLVQALADAQAEGIVQSRDKAVAFLKELQERAEGADGIAN